MRYRQNLGFTLLEMMIAIAIFAMLSISAYQVLQSVMLNDALTQKKSTRLSEIQRAFYIMERDFSSAILRPTSESAAGDESSHTFSVQKFLVNSDDWGATFTRNGWINPGGLLPRSELERVSYRLTGNLLERMSHYYPDPVPGANPIIVSMLTGVTEFRFRFFNNKQWTDSWRLSEKLPEGIELTLVLEDYGEIQRIFMMVNANSSSSSDPDEEES